ncbi:hypothetical protein D3C87_1332020 [compost metagenome]
MFSPLAGKVNICVALMSSASNSVLIFDEATYCPDCASENIEKSIEEVSGSPAFES